MRGKQILKIELNQASIDVKWQQDWARDTESDGSATTITRAQFRKALFELTDIWTAGLDEAEYLAFLQAIAFRVKYGNQQGTFTSPLRCPNEPPPLAHVSCCHDSPRPFI